MLNVADSTSILSTRIGPLFFSPIILAASCAAFPSKRVAFAVCEQLEHKIAATPAQKAFRKNRERVGEKLLTTDFAIAIDHADRNCLVRQS